MAKYYYYSKKSSDMNNYCCSDDDYQIKELSSVKAKRDYRNDYWKLLSEFDDIYAEDNM